jgi:PEP-CTERM motif-containing protein
VPTLILPHYPIALIFNHLKLQVVAPIGPQRALRTFVNVLPAARHELYGEMKMGRKSTLYAAVAIICLGLISATQVRADSTNNFVYQLDGNTFTWGLPSTPSVTSDNVCSGTMFTLPDISVSMNGGPAILGIMDFYSTSDSGGLDFYVGDYYYMNIYGPQLYSGPETSPTFLAGTFTSLTDYGNGNILMTGGTLQVCNAVPEPSSLLLLMIGLGFALAIYIVRVLAPLRSAI